MPASTDHPDPQPLGHGPCGGAAVVVFDTVTVETPLVRLGNQVWSRAEDGIPEWLDHWLERRARHHDELTRVCTSCGRDVPDDELVDVAD